MMRSRLRRWLEATALTNPVERGQASALQIMLMLIGAFGMLLIVLLVITLLSNRSGDINQVFFFLGLALVLITCSLGAVLILRRGSFQWAVVLAAVGFTVLHDITVITSGLANPEVLLVYLLPLTLAGLLSSHRALPAVLVIACAGVWYTALTTRAVPIQPAGTSIAAAPSSPPVTALNFTLVVCLVGVFFVVFGNVLAEALSQALARERELEELRRGLEQAVGERTAELRGALTEVEARAESEAALRHEAEEQRAIVRAMSVPVLPVSAGTLVVPLVGDLDTQRIADLQSQALGAAERTRCRRLVLDITGVPVVDTHVAQGLVHTMIALGHLGTEAVLVGIRPEVAQSLVSLGVNLGEFPTFADLQTALQIGTAPATASARPRTTA